MKQDPENLRLVFQLAHERNERVVAYIRVTDGAIWGFIGLVIVQFFKNGIKLNSPKVPIFCILFIAAMYLWRNRVSIYQKTIVKGYNRMVRCEQKLGIDDDVSITKNLFRDLNENCLINPRPKTFSDLCYWLDPDIYRSIAHVKMDWFAYSFSIIGILGLIFWCYLYFTSISLPYLVLLGIIFLIFWIYLWCFILIPKKY
jgi:hypothetical protein